MSLHKTAKAEIWPALTTSFSCKSDTSLKRADFKGQNLGQGSAQLRGAGLAGAPSFVPGDSSFGKPLRVALGD